MTTSDSSPSTDALQWTWPDWVPQSVRSEVEKFWSHWNRTRLDWLASATGPYNNAPQFGERVRLRLAQQPWREGRYVHAWNNIGRVVDDTGIAHCVSTCDYKSARIPPEEQQ